MKLLLIGLDGLRIDVALPGIIEGIPGFSKPHHSADPRFKAEAAPNDRPLMPALDPNSPIAPTLNRLLNGKNEEQAEVRNSAIHPVWMTPPTDSGPGWSSILTGTTHEQNNVWWNEFVGHKLATCPDILSRIFFANPLARTYAASTWDALTAARGAGPVIHQRVDQQLTGQHQLFTATDFSNNNISADAQVIAHACQILNHQGPDAAFIYLEQVDEAGHKYGSASKEYQQAIARVDEHVRYLIKAVAERYEALGEDWLIAITTDHGHKPEGGHGEDEIEVRRSFLLLHRLAGPLELSDSWLDLSKPKPLYSHEITPLLLDLLGVSEGKWQADHEVGLAQDIPSNGPTRNLKYEW